MFEPSARVLKDSVAPTGKRLTTMEVTGHRFILAEFNTHRVFSRNSASSRAIPYAKMREKALEQTAYPVSWPAEQRGMQGGEELSAEIQGEAGEIWHYAAMEAVYRADKLVELGVHKSVVNRLLEPFLPHTILVSSTEWQGFWDQRCHPDAQPEIRVLAEKMKEAYDASEPDRIGWDGWHVPLVHDEDVAEIKKRLGVEPYTAMDVIRHLLMISVARCARVSYLTHDGVRDIEKDIELFERLRDHTPPHASPFEHVATPSRTLDTPGNFTGWTQLRHIMEMS